MAPRRQIKRRYKRTRAVSEIVAASGPTRREPLYQQRLISRMELAMDAYCSMEAATPGYPRTLTWDDYRSVEEPDVPFDAMTTSKYAVTLWAFSMGSAPGDRRGS